MKHILCILLLIAAITGFSQTIKIDSLTAVLDTTSRDEDKIQLLNALSLQVRPIDFKKARDFGFEAERLAEKAGRISDLGRSRVLIGIAFYLEGNHEEAMRHYLSAMKAYESINDVRGKIETLNEMGTLEKKNHDLKNSEEHLLEALRLSQSLQDSMLIAHSMNNIGHVFEMKGDLKKAMDYYSVSAIIKENLGRLYDASFNYDNMANVLSKQGRYAEATTYYEKEITIFRNLKDKANYAIAINNLGEMNKLKGDYNKAASFFLQALEVSNEIHYKDLSSHIYRMLSETYEVQGNYQKAYSYMLSGNALKDSIFNEQRSKQLLDMQTKYETEKKENQIKILRQENELKDFGLRQNRLFILGLIMVVLGLIIVGYLWQTRMKLKQKAEIETTKATLRESQLQAVIGSQEEERKRFAADLHDGLGQIISALRLSLSKENPDKTTLDHALGLLKHMNVEIRNVAFNLMPQALMKDGLEVALKEFAMRLNRSGGVAINVNGYNIVDAVPTEQKIALYRICQEWVNNAIKYSSCTNISIQLVQHPEELVLTIEDDGEGFDMNILTLGQGNGWKNINSRLALIKGSMEIDSTPGRKGTTMIITVPVLALTALHP
ncbi:MAG TPA: tetratricopeptide repeat protein [Chryseosolibacter sp.]|nr:tetratricopeptide repeat protein [Chryseosolibacter sp.]